MTRFFDLFLFLFAFYVFFRESTFTLLTNFAKFAMIIIVIET